MYEWSTIKRKRAGETKCYEKKLKLPILRNSGLISYYHKQFCRSKCKMRFQQKNLKRKICSQTALCASIISHRTWKLKQTRKISELFTEEIRFSFKNISQNWPSWLFKPLRFFGSFVAPNIFRQSNLFSRNTKRGLVKQMDIKSTNRWKY